MTTGEEFYRCWLRRGAGVIVWWWKVICAPFVVVATRGVYLYCHNVEASQDEVSLCGPRGTRRPTIEFALRLGRLVRYLAVVCRYAPGEPTEWTADSPDAALSECTGTWVLSSYPRGDTFTDTEWYEVRCAAIRDEGRPNRSITCCLYECRSYAAAAAAFCL